MKRTVALFLSLLMALSLCACGGEDGFQAQYDELIAELTGYADQCNDVVPIVEKGWQSTQEMYYGMDDASVRTIVANGIRMATLLSVLLDHHDSISAAVTSGEISANTAYSALVEAARVINPDNWKGVDKNGKYYGTHWDSAIEDETIEICHKLRSALLAVSESDIAERIDAIQEEYGNSHQEECDRLDELCQTVSRYTSFLSAPSGGLSSFRSQVQNYQNTIDRLRAEGVG